MKESQRRFSIQEKLDILNEVDQFGTTHSQSKYDLSPSTLSRWEKDLKKSKARQSAIKKQEDALVIESMKSEIEQLKKVIANQSALLPKTEKKPQVKVPTTSTKADELYRLVASLIVQNLVSDVDEEPDHSPMLER